MANLVSTTITGTLNATSTITGPGAGVSAINASNVSTGTLASDRLPTVPTSKGGTGLTSVGSSGQVLTVTGPGALAFQDAAGGGVGGEVVTAFNSPGTFTANAATQFISVEVIGGGGGGGGAQGGNPGSTGQSSSFGSFVTATGGNGGGAGGGGGGSGGSSTGNVPLAISIGGNGTGGRPGPGQTPTPGGLAGGASSGLSAGNGASGGRGNLYNIASGGGGGGAGVAFAVLGGPQYSPTQAITVGSGGPGGSGMSQANAGGTGQAGKVTVVEYIS